MGHQELPPLLVGIMKQLHDFSGMVKLVLALLRAFLIVNAESHGCTFDFG